MSSQPSIPKTRTNAIRPVLFSIGGAVILFLLLLFLNQSSDDAQTNTKSEDETPKREGTIAVKPPVLPHVEIRALEDPDPGVGDGAKEQVLRGRFLNDKGEPIPSQPYWVHWGRQYFDEQGDLAEITRPLAHAKRTDALGRFSVRVRAPGRGLLWFHAPAGLRAACVINAETLKTRAWHDIRLPKTDIVSIKGIGVSPSARFRVVVSPATKSRGGWDASEIETWPSQFWKRSDAHVDFLVTHSFESPEFIGSGHIRVLAWRPFELNVKGKDFEVQAEEGRYRVTRAPGVRMFRAGKKTPSGILVVRDSSGGSPTEVSGIAITGSQPGEGQWSERRALERGRCGLGYQMLRAGETHHLCVVMADGEFFKREIEVADAAPQATVTLVRGQGRAPLRIPVELGSPSGHVTIIAETSNGQIVRGRPWSRLEIEDRHFGYVLRNDAALLVRSPRSFAGLFVMCEDGRVAAGRDRATWLPGEVIPDIDLGDAYQRLGRQAQARAEFDLEITTKSGRKYWITLDRCTMDPKTRWFPVWSKFVPTGMRYRFAFAVAGEEPVELVPGQ